METLAGLALVYAAQNKLDSAQAALQEVLSSITPQHRAALRQWAHYVAYRVYVAREEVATAKTHLQHAATAMQSIAGPLPEADRDRFLEKHPLNRQVQAALESLTQRIEVRLVRADVPLGRKLSEADYTAVTWTIYTPQDDLLANAAERRQHVICRLLAEAKAQGGAATDADLAQALGVSRRTILRDMKAIADKSALPTRRRGAAN